MLNPLLFFTHTQKNKQKRENLIRLKFTETRQRMPISIQKVYELQKRKHQKMARKWLNFYKKLYEKLL